MMPRGRVDLLRQLRTFRYVPKKFVMYANDNVFTARELQKYCKRTNGKFNEEKTWHSALRMHPLMSEPLQTLHMKMFKGDI